MNKLTILTTVAAITLSSGAFAQSISADALNVKVTGVDNAVKVEQIGTKTSRVKLNVGDRESQMGKNNDISITQKNGDKNNADINLTGGDRNNITLLQEGSRNNVKATLGKDDNNFGVKQIGSDNLVDIDGQANMNNGRFNGQINQTGTANKFKFKTYAVDKDTNLTANQTGSNNSIDVLNRHGEVSGKYTQTGNDNKISLVNNGTSEFNANQEGDRNLIDIEARHRANTIGSIDQKGNDNQLKVKNYNTEKGIALKVTQTGDGNQAGIVDNTNVGGNDYNRANLTQEGNALATISFDGKHNRGGNNTATVFQAAGASPVNVSIAGRSNNVTVTQK